MNADFLILHGNCQAEAMTSVLAVDPLISTLCKVAYSRSYVHPSEGQMRFDRRKTKRCALLWEQHDPRTFPQRSLLPRECLTIKFPSADLNLLWPFDRPNPFNRPEPPRFPFGRFSYGDRIIVNAVNRGMNADDILDYYVNGWEEYKIDLDRLLQLETARIQGRDIRCNVKIGEFILRNFRKVRLFWTVNHPTPLLLSELLERLLAASDPVQPALADMNIEQTLAAHFEAGGPLGGLGVPIHPKIAEHLELEWYDPNERYQSWDGKTYSYVEYFEGMIHQALRARTEGAVSPTRVQ